MWRLVLRILSKLGYVPYVPIRNGYIRTNNNGQLEYFEKKWRWAPGMWFPFFKYIIPASELTIKSRRECRISSLHDPHYFVGNLEHRIFLEMMEQDTSKLVEHENK